MTVLRFPLPLDAQAIELINHLDAAAIDVSAASRGRTTLARLIFWVCIELRIGREELIGRSNQRDLIGGRQAIAWVARSTPMGRRSLSEIGRALGGRDHTTIATSFEKAAARREFDPEFRSLTDMLVGRVKEDQTNDTRP